MKAVRSGRNRVENGSCQRRGSPSKSSQSKDLDNSFTALAMSRAHSFKVLRGSDKVKACDNEEQGRSAKQSRSVKKIRGKQKTIGEMFVEDDFEAVSFGGGGDDFTTTSATTATTKSSAAKLVPVKAETVADMDPFANIDNGFSDWNYGSKGKAKVGAETARERGSRRRSSMNNVSLSIACDTEAPKDESKEHRRRSRRSSLDLTLTTEKSSSRRRADTSVSSGVSGQSNGSRSNSGREKRSSSRREGPSDANGRSDRKQRNSRRRATMDVGFESSTSPQSKEKADVEPAVRRGTSRRASLSMVAASNISSSQEVPRRTRRASLNMATSDAFPTDFAANRSGGTTAQEQDWDESGFKIIK